MSQPCHSCLACPFCFLVPCQRLAAELSPFIFVGLLFVCHGGQMQKRMKRGEKKNKSSLSR